MSQIYLGSSSTPSVPTSFDANTGSAVPVANVLNLVGTGNIETTGAGNTITISEKSTYLNPSYTQVEFVDTPYTVDDDFDYYISVDSSGGPITILLPDAPAARQEFVVKDRTGDALANNITITTVGGVVLMDGLTSNTIDDAYESFKYIFNATSYEVF